jgi:simple sugar transport system ATP-binding protein
VHSASVELRGITKRYGSATVNDHIDLTLRPGEVHGLIGENGAGKSTLMSILAGLVQPDSGEIVVSGEQRTWRSARDASLAGIGMVHQHFMISESHTLLDNAVLGAEPTKFSGLPKLLQPIDRSGAEATLQGIADQTLPWRTPMSELPVETWQRVEILKVLFRHSNILIFDEPTAVLTPQQTHELLAQLRAAADSGKTVLIITHKLREILSVADTVTILRRGKIVGSKKASETNEAELAEMMVGRPVQLLQSRKRPPVRPEVVVEVDGVSLRSKQDREFLQSVTLQVKAGEIVGIAGVEGNGQQELCDLLADPRSFFRTNSLSPYKRATGDLKFFETSAKERRNAELRAQGCGFIPGDRIRAGLLLDGSIEDNLLLGQFCGGGFVRAGFVRRGKLAQNRAEAYARFDVRGSAETVRGLSGGNQQKLVIARELTVRTRFLLAAHPTRGVDVGAIEQIHAELVKARENGVGILLVSSEISELLALADRILVFYRGKVAKEFLRSEYDPALIKDTSDCERRIGLAMGGVEG